VKARRDALAGVARAAAIVERVVATAREIRQPLTAIIANGHACQRLLAEPTPELDKARAAIADMIAGAVRANALIDEMREGARLDLPSKGPININEAIRDVLRLARPDARTHRVSIRTDLAADLPPAIADRSQVQYVVLSLVLAGIQAMTGAAAQQRRVLTVRSRRSDHSTLVVSVEAASAGAEPVVRDGLDLSASALWISKSIVESHGGDLLALTEAPNSAGLQFSLQATDAAGHTHESINQ
jgi:signal transduction histidine kinase